MTNRHAGTLARALLALGLVGAVAVAAEPAASTAALNGTVTICHQTLDPANPVVTITVSTAAWPAHQAHGDLPVDAYGLCFVDNDPGTD